MPDRFASMKFPTAGIDLSNGYDSQRPLTTVLASNVRAFDAMALRGSGGVRPGLSTYLPQVSGDNPVQSLNAIVTVSGLAIGPGGQLPIKSPWPNFSLKLTLDYSESNNPPTRNAPTVVFTLPWTEFTQFNQTLTSGTIGPPESPDPGSVGNYQVNLTAVFNDPDKFDPSSVTSVTFTATLVRLGGPWDFMSGTTVVNSATISTANLLLGSTFGPDWTGVQASSGNIMNGFLTVAKA
jgi:hypothetical protein